MKNELKFEDLMNTVVNEDGTYTLEFKGNKNYFLNNVEAPEAENDEFYFDDKETVNKLIAEADEDDIEEA